MEMEESARAAEAPQDKLEGSSVHHSPEENQEQDVPEDFFDDFLKEDFMAGLDIVDEDNEQEGLKNIAIASKKKEKIDHVKQFNAGEPEKKTKLNMKGQELRVEREELERLDQELEQIRQEKFRRSILDDIRRDPEKTRQAIQKDKIKSAKDKEKKLITDIVETGLVPPGMELEMDIDDQVEVITDLREKIRGGKAERSLKRRKLSKSKSSSRSDDLLTKSKIMRRRSPLLRRSPRSRRSPQFRRSPIRLSRSPRRRRLRRSSTRSPRRRSKTRSPSYRRYRKSPSPRRRRRSRSISPRPRREEKKSFLEELVAKLNETHPPSNPAVVTPTFTPHFIAQQQMMMPQTVFFNQGYMEPIPPMAHPPIKAPQPPPPIPKEDPYDESFFIGNDVSPLSSNVQSTSAKMSQKNGTENVDRNPTKLFEDKKINLSDFLSLTAKPQVSSTSSSELHGKVKVIQRCQDAITMLTERRTAGPLIVHKINTPQLPKDKTTSPLLRSPPIKLAFTTPGARTETERNFRRCCEILLYKVGIEKNLSTIEKEPRKVPPKEVVASFSSTSEHFPSQSRTFGTQTEKEMIRCNECLRRKGILQSHAGVQTGKEISASFSVSTQVNEADFYSMIPKTQSLASLTPAQLLGKSAVTDQKVSVNLDQLRASINRINSQNKYVPSPPPAPQMAFQNPPMPESSYPSMLYGQQLFAPNVPQRPQYHQRRGGYNNNQRF